MCLYVNQEATQKFKRFNRKKEITVYKMLLAWDNQYFTPYRRVPVKFGEELVASGDLIDGASQIHGGAIHVYIDLDAAIEHATFGCDRIVVKCTAKASDFVAEGHNLCCHEVNVAAFKAITIPENPEVIRPPRYYV